MYRGCPTGTHPCAPDAQAVWHRSQSANSCCAGRCVVVRIHGLWIMPSVRFVLCSLTPLLDMVTTCGPVDLKRHFAPLVAHHSLTRLFFWFHLTASAVLLFESVSEASDLHLNSLLALAAGLLFSCADGCDCNRRAASTTSCNIQYKRFADDTWFI